MKQLQFYTLKFNSDRLDKYKYNIQITHKEALKNNELVQIFENQLIESILDIKGVVIDDYIVNKIKKEIKYLKSLESSNENSEKINRLQDEYMEMLYVPEYVTIKMDKTKHYDYMFKKFLYINGIKYRRFNSSAGQARENTVLFIADTVFDELRRRTDNGRNLDMKIAPSKLNAYRGLYGSARHKVSRPRFCVVADYESELTMKVNFVTEVKNNHEDDELEEDKEIKKSFNRFDGQGLISPLQAEKWAIELGLDYTPSEFCLRGSFLKGMVCVFDFHQWIEEENDGNSIINTIYKDENGNPIQVDLNDVDLIITESQMKLWDSWDSVEHYNKCCDENEMSWGISLYTPKYDKTFMYENYQFLQTLNLDNEDVNKITSKFVDWIKGVTSENVYYTMLFLLGMNGKENRFLDYIEHGENHWIRAFILEPKLIHDKHIRMKIYNLLKKKISEAALGKIIVDGNFQVIVSDPYAMMEHIVDKKVIGLLGIGEHYSNYWNERNVKKVVGSRSPLTYRSEHVILNLVKNEKTEKWFKHLKSGIVLNAHGDETDRFAGSDFDYDILATTSDESVIKGVYRNELPIVYKAPKPEKIVPTEDDLFRADKFSFNSIIGTLTNKSTSAYALLSQLSPDSDEYKITLKRIKTITKAQSAQIDKTKIGQKVKGVVTKWINYEKPPTDVNGNLVEESDEDKRIRELNNRILLDKHPYFFIHLYKNTRKKYKDHVKKYEILCLQRLGITFDELKRKQRKSKEELQFLDEYNRFNPVIESDCVMNKICWRIESVNFEIKNLLKNDTLEDLHELFLNNDVNFNENTYEKIKKAMDSYKKSIHEIMQSIDKTEKSDYNDEKIQEINVKQRDLNKTLIQICSNEKELMNYIITLFYVDNKYNKDIMWNLFGDLIVQNLKKQKQYINIPVLDTDGEIEYLNNHYSIKQLEVM